ncbi:hypothetical protein R3W88_032267 [Solanum pinnatisectum]|uniref:Uncharacterized protein n=1 Tax=Solanum pinnatisectum TaxID=50273 RepID=A0AAV9LRB9_9SOLN|nr:hypothetical protein R3W88_032267 [Solanum pinnatisectum]
MGDNVEDTGLTDVVVAQPVVAYQNELIMLLMQQIAEMRVEMQRRQDSPNPAFAFNAPADRRPPLHFPPSSMEQAQNPPSSPAHNPSIIDLTTQNPHYTSVSYQTPPPSQNTNLQVPLPLQNANLQTGPPPQNQNFINPQTFIRHQNQHTNPQTLPQNYLTPQNAQSPSITPPLPQEAIFQIPVPNELDAHGSELDHYEERERESRVPIALDELERAVASLSIREKKEFVILTPEKAVALVPRETPDRPKFVIETAVTQGMTRSGRCYTPEELPKKDQSKRSISETKAEEFWRKMQPKDYSIVKHLEKTLAQISVWALLISSQLHRQSLMKALDDTYVPVGTNSDNLAAMINQVVREHRIGFCDEELPFEGKMHNKALHVTIMCRDKIINRVLDINTSYNLLLGRPFIHMARAVPFTLHQLMKFVWKDRELVIYSERSHSNGYAPIVDDVS